MTQAVKSVQTAYMGMTTYPFLQNGKDEEELKCHKHNARVYALGGCCCDFDRRDKRILKP